MGQNKTKMQSELQNSVLNKSIQDVLNKNTANVNNVIDLGNEVNIEVGNGGVLNAPSGIHIDQQNVGNAKMTLSISNDSANDMKTSVETSLQTKGSQTDKLVQGFLAGIGSNNDRDVKMRMTNSITNVVEKHFKTENLNNILNKVSAKNGSTIRIGEGAVLNTSDIEILQKNSIEFTSNMILNSLAESVTSDTMVNRSAMEGSQVASTEQKGLDSLLSGPLMVIIALILAGGLTAGQMAGKMHWIILAIGGLMIVYIITAVVLKSKGTYIYPFEAPVPPEYWICETNDKGFNTGNGKQVDEATANAEKAKGATVFGSQALLDKAVADGARCQQYYRCDTGSDGFNTGSVTQCKSLIIPDPKNASATLSCPFKTMAETTVCNQVVYRCDRTNTKNSDDNTVQSVNCTRLNYDQLNPRDEIFKGSNDAAAKTSCTNKCKPQVF